jgi:hypothetical protein
MPRLRLHHHALDLAFNKSGLSMPDAALAQALVVNKEVLG